jgi:hypothetical protein
MRLMRNISKDGYCKYAAIRNDKIALLPEHQREAAREAMEVLADLEVLENPRMGDAEEFFLIKLKDWNAPWALAGYAKSVAVSDPEFAADVMGLAAQALRIRKNPD